jgi:hypothetical protein
MSVESPVELCESRQSLVLGPLGDAVDDCDDASHPSVEPHSFIETIAEFSTRQQVRQHG